MRRIFWGFLQKLFPHRSLKLLFEPFRYWLLIRGDIHNRKTTHRVGESATLRVRESMTGRLGESAFECFKRKLSESESWRLLNSASRGVAVESLFKFF
jgi:hypothetical protein